MTNFDFLLKEKKFESFAPVAVTAEKLYSIDIPSCVFNIRRALEFAVKWMYTVDGDLVMPYQDNLAVLISTEEFRNIIDNTNLLSKIDYIRRLGNNSAHKSSKISPAQAELGLENLFSFLDFIACCYAEEYKEQKFNPALINSHSAENAPKKDFEIDIDKLIEENKALKEKLTQRREKQSKQYASHTHDYTEYETRKLYIDTFLQDAGWVEGKDWINEYELFGMPNNSGVGYADYVLFGNDGKPLAVVEAKRTSRDLSEGRQQAKLYADLLEKKFQRRPIIFLSNGFEMSISNEPYYNEHKVSGFYSKRDLEKEFNKLTMRESLDNITVSKDISGRYYQEEAVKRVCRAFDEENKRKALLVMATGSGKTRTVISIVDVLIKHGWIKNVLFLADRRTLVRQAKRSFVNLLPNLSCTNLCEEKDNLSARAVFSTYQTMMSCIDNAKDENGEKLFTVGHFDLIICDEAHRSIYNKYQDIFNYFDSLLVGLTATPKDEIDRDTYKIFELTKGIPTYGYELDQAVEDKFLVDYESIESELKFVSRGITYDELSDDEKQEYEDFFTDENGEMPEKIDSKALNTWVFNEDTVIKVLNILMTQGLKVDYGSKIGKTVIFAKNHRHAVFIKEIFDKQYPKLTGYCKVIDNKTEYAQSLIDDFSEKDKLPQIVVSVDMMDTGIDVPEILNLVFFKSVMSKSKFWQMIGRGTRLCPKLIDGEDKEKFYIFDFCGNFEFFRVNAKGKEGISTSSVQQRIFNLKADMILKLQDLNYQKVDELKEFRDALVDDVLEQVSTLERNNFAVKQHLRYVDKFSDRKSFDAITYEETMQLSEEIAPLLELNAIDINAVRFDALMYGIEKAYIYGEQYKKARKDLFNKVAAVAKVATIPDVKAKSELIDKILHTDYVEKAGINEFEHIREELRDIIKYIPNNNRPIYLTTFDDEVVVQTTNPSDLKSDDLVNYKHKVNSYIKKHMNDEIIAKLHTNKPLTNMDIETLKNILWHDLGTKDDYTHEYKDKSIGVLVREIVGLDMSSAKEAFSKFLTDVNLNDRQIYFLNQIINYIVKNGTLMDLGVLNSSPFTDRGDLSDVFTDTSVWLDIMKTIRTINDNAMIA